VRRDTAAGRRARVRGRVARPAGVAAATLEEVSKVDMKKQPYLAKDRIFKTLHPTFIPKPRPLPPPQKRRRGRVGRLRTWIFLYPRARHCH
jgi:hypothetical protein